MTEVSANRCFGGWQRVFEHPSSALAATTRVGVFLPPGAERGDLPVLLFLSGLTCTEQNVITKAGAQRYCAEHNLILVTPDTSPRGEGVADDEGWDLGQGAGFYVDATQAPWSTHFKMDSFVTKELPAVLREFTSNEALGVTGHSMGGHGAITLALRNPGLFRSVSAFAPILQPTGVPWGTKAFGAYLGADRSSWSAYDATALISTGLEERLPILIDQGADDGFLAEQLPSEAFLAAAKAHGHPVSYRLQPGYDHSYYFGRLVHG